MKYRRLYVPGGTFFFTLTTEKRRAILVEHINILREAFLYVIRKYPFSMEAIVILPDHLHTVWNMHEDDFDYSKRWMLIKKNFSAELPAFSVSASKTKKREKGIWQRRFWEHLIRDENDLRNHYDYIHYNPVKHGLTKRPGDWKYSSFNRYVKQGLYPKDWGETEPENIGGMDIE
ncbi:MAG: transposase [Proteobacteria bacterium]|nr:transposase [Pseudomonadota bacterium]